MDTALPILVLVALATSAAPPERPRDPWVFRSVLDQRPRIVTIALAPDLWVAYDATTCALYRAWRGDVLFEGAVFNTVHGPQPTRRGDDLDDPLAGGRWRLARGGSIEDLAPVYRGHRFSGDPAVAATRVTLEFELKTAGGDVIKVAESPERAAGFERRFTVSGVPGGARLVLEGAPAASALDRVIGGSDLQLALGRGSFAPDPRTPGAIRMVRTHRIELSNGEHRLLIALERSR